MLYFATLKIQADFFGSIKCKIDTQFGDLQGILIQLG